MVMTMKRSVYLAGSSHPEEMARVDRCRAALVAAGVEVTSTWTDDIRAVGRGGNPRDALHPDRWRWSIGCLRQVEAAAAYWMLVPDPARATRGAWWEAGFAYGLARPLFFSGDTRQSIFTALGTEFSTLTHAACDDTALEAVLELLGGRAPAGAGAERAGWRK